MAKPKSRPIATKEDIFVSVVMVIMKETEQAAKQVKTLADQLHDRYTNYEIVIVDNRAEADEVAAVTAQLETTPCLRIVTLSQQVKYDTAIFAGLEMAIGDFVCTLNASGDPIEKLGEIITLNRSHPVVQGVSTVPMTSSAISRLGRRLFYWYTRKYIEVDIPLNATYFATYNRSVVNALTGTQRSHRHIRHLVRLIGFTPYNFEYTPTHSILNQRTLKVSALEAIEISASYSTHPLRFVTWLGFFAGITNILYIFYIVLVNITQSSIREGWTTTSLQLSVMFFILFAIMVVLAEYIGRILVESRRERPYYVTDEKSSSVGLADESRRNIEV